MTKETKHTPGPWRAECGMIYAGDERIAFVPAPSIGIAQREANAVLIAAAPELRARVLSLENCLSVISYYLGEPNGITVKRMKELCDSALDQGHHLERS